MTTELSAIGRATVSKNIPKPLRLPIVGMGLLCLVLSGPLSVPLRSNPVSLLKDINDSPTSNGVGKSFANAILGTDLLVAANDGLKGVELWKTDGTAGGTVLVKDIRVGPDSASPQAMANIGGRIFFRADDGVHGVELWSSDGTEAGTALVADIQPGALSATPERPVNFGGLAYFAANDGVNGRELWKSDGTSNGTVMVKDINPGGSGSNPGNLLSYGGTLFFVADDGINGIELWKSDGTAGGTVLVKDIYPGVNGSTVGAMVGLGAEIYFTAEDGTSGRELWCSDGTSAGTFIVKDIFAGPGWGFPGELTVVGSALYFSATDSNGVELWKSDGTAVGTLLVTNLAPGSSSSSPQWLINFGGTLFFAATTAAEGQELWKSDGTPAGTTLVKDIRPGSIGSSLGYLRVAGASLFFYANDGVAGGELWKSDGSTIGTVMVKDLFLGANTSDPYNLVNLNGTLIFSAIEPATGSELHGSDGTAAGTSLIRDINLASPPSSPNRGFELGTNIYFWAEDSASGRELWQSGGNSNSTAMLKDIQTGPSSSIGYGEESVVLLETNFLFSAYSELGQELWRSDGTTAGTVLLKDVNPGPGSGLVRHLTIVGSNVFFAAYDGVNINELWKSDGTAAGTVLVKNVGGGATSIGYPTDVNGTLFFSSADASVGNELWKSDGAAAGTVKVKDILIGSVGSGPANLINVNGTFFFTAGDTLFNTELWKSDGTSVGTVVVKEINPSTASNPSSLINATGTLFFAASDNLGAELWRSDGSAAGTVRVKDIRPGANGSFPANLFYYQGRVYFSADDGVAGAELWSSDGTDAGTSLVKDINPGSGSSTPVMLGVADGLLFIAADDGTNGVELWQTDGTTAGTVLVMDINPGAASSFPTLVLLSTNGTLYFSADDGFHGRELWLRTPDNQSPIVANPIPDQTNTYGGEFNFTFVTNTFSDPDAGQTLTYTVLALPPGIDFDGPTRTFSSTNLEVADYTVVVVATDDGTPALSVTNSFQLTVGKAVIVARPQDQISDYGVALYLDPYFGVDYTGFVLDENLFYLDVFPDFSPADTSVLPVGSHPLSLSGGLDDHYTFEFQPGTLTVLPAELRVLVDDSCRPAGQTNPTLTATFYGLRNGDNITANLITPAGPASPVGAYPIAAKLNDPGNRLANYVVTTNNGTLHVVNYTADFEIVRSFGFTNLMVGTEPSALIVGSDGALYGTARYGGSGQAGTVFKLTTNGTGVVLHHFTGGPGDGGSPEEALLEGSDGLLYGTTTEGGSSNAGTVFVLQKNGSNFSVLRSFTRADGDGATPGCQLLEGMDGALYGTTELGGSNDLGSVFKLDRNGSNYSVLYRFGEILNDGYQPTAGLVQGSDGFLYGITTHGGANDFPGTLYKLNTNGGGYSLLRSFSFAASDARNPVSALVADGSGVLYGATPFGGSSDFGTAFRINEDGSGFSILHSFTWSAGDGAYPNAPLLLGNDGLLYGATSWGGTNAFPGRGTVFKVNPNGSGYTIIRHVGSNNGLTQAGDSTLFGSSTTAFRLSPDGSDLADFWTFSESGGDGINPFAALIEGSDGMLYGMAPAGGSADYGVIFRLNKDGSGAEVLRSFSDDFGDGQNPLAQLLEGADGALYGTTPYGGAQGYGSVFTLNKDGSGFLLLHSFGATGTDGHTPVAGLVQGTNGLLYGTTVGGGLDGRGTVFKLATNGAGYAVIHNFESTSEDGWLPRGRLLPGSDGMLYGTTPEGGTNYQGTAFKLAHDGSGYAVFHHFNYDDGQMPWGSLLEGADGRLYGLTRSGGPEFGKGVLYRIDRDGSGYVILRHFGRGSRDAASPSLSAQLVAGPDGALYGTTDEGGAAGFGTIFRFEADGSDYCVLHSFSAAVGLEGMGRPPLLLASDGHFYGTMDRGGAFNLGAVYRLRHSPLAANQSPVVLNPIPDQTNTYGGSFNFTFAANTVTDPDIGQTLTYSASGLPPGIVFDGPSRTFSGTLTNVGAFSVTVIATDDGTPAMGTNDVFDLVVEKAPLLAVADNKMRGYGAGNPSLAISYSGFVPGETEAVLGFPPVVGTVADPASPVGNYPITLTGGSDAHYNLTLSNGILTVTQAVLIASVDDLSRLYGEANPPLTATLVAVVNGDNITASNSTTATVASPPGDYPITLELLDPEGRLGNYFVTTNHGVLSVLCPTNVAVTTTNDSGPGSLRNAIAFANSDCPTGRVFINFNIPGAGPHTIAPITALPDITRPVVIDGYTQPGATVNTLTDTNNATLMVVVQGVNAGAGVDGLTIRSSNCVVRGLVLNGWEGSALVLATNEGCVIEGNFLGLLPSGVCEYWLMNAANGIHLLESSGNRIGGTTPAARNVISGNARLGGNAGGLRFTGSNSWGNVILGNLIGPDANGTTASQGNYGPGILLEAAPGNIIGGEEAGARNIISRNGLAGIFIGADSDAARVQGNYIGTDASGTLALGNNLWNVALVGGNNLIGGTNAAARNVISGNTGDIGIGFVGISSGTIVQGNFIGVDATGTNALPNQDGISYTVFNSASGILIGGETVGAGNVISGNTRSGIYLVSVSGLDIQGNIIGTDATATLALPNGEAGVLCDGCIGARIGGTNLNEGNIIAYNQGPGISVYGDAVNNAVRGNQIHDNSGLGIDLGTNGVTFSDFLDLDTGANHLQNFPVLATALTNGANLTITGALHSRSNATFAIDFYANAACDSSTFGEGEVYLGATIVTTDSSGDASFTAMFPLPANRTYATATATDDDGNTSEFSSCVPMAAGTLELVTVTSLADSGVGSLRAAVSSVSLGGTIDFAVTGTITLTSEQLELNRDVNIIGPGATNLTVSGGNNWRIFNVTTGMVVISGLTIANGSDSADFLVGAGIRNNANLHLSECVISNNVSEASGGGLFNRPNGVVVVDRCLFVDNKAVGAFQGGGSAGAIANQGVLFVTNSTFSGNSAGFSAGAIRNTGGMILESSTFTRNTASECPDCEGIPGVVVHLGANAVVHNTIVGGNTNYFGVFRDVTGAMDGGDYNLVEYASGYIGAGTNDLLGVSPQLAPLADNGGPTHTHLPLPVSPVIDEGDPLALLTLDQRGFSRPQNSRADIGAVETAPALAPPTMFITGDGMGNVTISWTPPTPGFVLQTNLTLNPASWGDALSGSTNPVVVPVANGAEYFRLRE